MHSYLITDTCILGLTDFIRGEISKGRLVGMVLLDLQKAFDCVDHELLLLKLKGMGVKSTDWFRSYLTDRRQCTVVGGVSSGFLGVTCGVPQGSILGPTLFLCYINDMAAGLKCRVSLYADDSTLIASGGSGEELSRFLSSELAICRDWMTDNGLSLHLGKTECMVFGSKKRLKKVGEFAIRCGDTTVSRVQVVRYLGFLLDETLSGSDQASTSLKRIASRLAFLYRNAAALDLYSRKILCAALVQPHFDYCISAWYSGTLARFRDRLDVMQRKMARFTLSLDYRAHVDFSLFKGLGWLSVPDRVNYFKLLHVFRVFSGSAPLYLTENFTRLKDVHGYYTRGSDTDFHVPCIASSNIVHRSFFYTAIKEWNALPSELKLAGNEKKFKMKLKRFLLARY